MRKLLAVALLVGVFSLTTHFTAQASANKAADASAPAGTGPATPTVPAPEKGFVDKLVDVAKSYTFLWGVAGLEAVIICWLLLTRRGSNA